METSLLLRRLGFAPTYAGFPYLACSIDLVLADERCLYQIFKRLYPEVAQRFQTSAACVERDIRTLIQAFWRTGGQAVLSGLTGRPIPGRPTNSELIALLAGYLQYECAPV